MTEPNKLHHTMTVGDLMSTGVHTARESDTISDTHSAMRVCRIRHLPVLDEDDKLIGVISDRDLLLGWTRGPRASIGSIMTRNLQYVHPSTSAIDAAERMLHDKIGCLPVLNDQREVVGILTETDFVEVAHRALTMLQAISMQEAS
jgi:CBS domain-containing protein